MVLWLAIAGVLVLIFWGVARSWVTSNLRHESEADVESLLAEVVAESAVAEAEARVGWAVNALESPLAEMFRRQVLANETGELDLSNLVTLPQTRAMLDDAVYRGYSIDRFESRVVYQKQIDNIPTERRALVVFSVSVSSPGLVRRAARKLEIGRWAKITLTAPPRPFGNFGLFLLDAVGLTNADAVNRGRDRALSLLKQGREMVKTAASPALKAQFDELLAQTFDPDGAQPPPAPFVFPDGAALYGLAESRDAQRLKDLDLAARLQELNGLAEKAQADLAGASGGGDPNAVLAAGRTALAAEVAPLTELWNFERNYAVLPQGAAAWKSVAGVTYKLDDAYFRRRAHYELKEVPGHDISADLKALLDGPAQGVIAIDNRAPVTIAGTVPGRVVLLVGPGGATLRSVNPTDAATGMVTVVCSAGPVRVSGTNTVSLMLVDGATGRGTYQLTMDRDARVHGSLIATGVPPGGFNDGELERDDRTFSGFTDPSGKENGVADRFFVGLSPRTYFRRMVKL